MTAAERAEERASAPPPPPDQAAGATSARPADPRPKEWPAPRPLAARALAPVPAFDFALLPDDLRWYVEDIAERMQVAPDIVAVAAMCAVSIIAANARTLLPKRFDTTWRVYSVLSGLAIAPAGSMKSPAIAPIGKLLAKIEMKERERFEALQHERQAAHMIAEALAEARKSRLKAAAKKDEPIDAAALAAELRAEGDEQAAEPRLRRLVATDATTEKLAMLVANGKRRCWPMIVWCDELAGLLSSFEREGRESDRAFYLAAWSVTNHTVDRVTRGSLFCRDLAISIFGAMTPGPFERYVHEAAGGDGADGFLQRLQLMVYPDPPKEWRAVDRRPEGAAEERALAIMERLFALDQDDEHDRPPTLHFAPEAQEVFDRWIEALEHQLRDPRAGLSEPRRGHLSKYRSLMPALALVCHLASGPGAEDQPVTRAATVRAVAWCAYLDAHADRVYSMARDAGWIDAEIVRRIQTGKIKPGVIPVRDIQRMLPGSVKAAEVEAACEVLEEHGWLVLEEVRKASRGRPSLVAHINPKGAAETSPEGAAA